MQRSHMRGEKTKPYKALTLLDWIQCIGRDSAVGIATRYELEGPGIESR
jgi:hypothetical protein